MTISDLVAAYREEHVLSGLWAESTVRRLMRQLETLRRVLGRRDAATLGPRDLGDLLHQLRATPAEAGCTSDVLRALLRWGREEGYLCGPNRLRRVKRYRCRTRTRVLTSEEWRQLWDAFGEQPLRYSGSWSPPACCRLLLLTGLRISEARSLSWDSVSLRFRSAALSLSKNKRETAPLPQRAVALLESLPRTSGWVFPSPRSSLRYAGDTTVWQAWTRAARSCGIAGTHPHCARRTIGTRAHDLGIPPALAARLIGDSPEVYLRHYVALNDRDLLDAADRVVESLAQ